MRVRTKLIVVILFVALVPVAVSAWTTLAVHQAAFDDKVRELQLVSAGYGATLAQSQLEASQRGLAGIVQRSTHWPSLSAAEREGASWLVFGQLDEIAAVVVIDGSDRLLEPAAYLPSAVTDAEWAAHPHLEAGSLADLGRSVPLGPARERGVALGEAQFVADEVLLPVGFAVEGATAEAPRWVVGVVLSLSSICARLREHRPPRTRVAMWDAQGRQLCPSSEAAEVPFREVRAAGTGTLRHRTREGTELLAAAATTEAGWSVVIAQPAADALAPGRRIQRQTWLWIAIGVLGALFTGTYLARGITIPLRALERGARRVAGGDYGVRIAVDSADEIGEVAASFNAMSDEIRVWNAELQQRVEDRTRELREAQDQLLEARKLGAMASLSAGVAHEINNPLTSVLAFTQLMLARARRSEGTSEEVTMLTTMENEALRIQDIVSRMQRLSQHESTGLGPVTADALFDLVASRMERQLTEGSVEVIRAAADDLSPISGNRGQLTTALEYLCDNALKAMQETPRRLTFRARDVEGELVALEVEDNGRGMAPEHVERAFEPFYTTKDDWRGVGLGLSVVHRIVTNHGGTVRIRSTPGEGTTVTLTLPTHRGGAHLA
jgi:two-component system NtrC family sensor kinase